MQRVAMLSVHTSPLAQPGAGDGGGMNVYVRALASALARAGVAVDVLTRAEHPEQPPCVEVEPGFRVLHVPAGPCAPVPLRDLPDLVGAFTDEARAVLTRAGGYDVLHANYWVSGAVGHRLKHELDLPLVTTFHTLARVKAEVGLGDAVPLRPRVEAEVVRCADLVVASTREEHDQLVRHYGADPERIEIIPPGVDHAVFSPGDRAAARRHVGLAGGPVLLFVGRIQPLKGADLAVRTLAEVRDRRALLVVSADRADPTASASSKRCTHWSPSSASSTACASSPRSRTSGSPTTTAPPTCASCRRAPSRSGSSRSRPRRAARRSSRPTSVGCDCSSTTASPGSSSTIATPRHTRRAIDRILERRVR